jgi:uncharacterized protein YabE (DUF348 family)
MNIPSKLNKLHSFYGKAKYAFLTVFVLTIMFSAFVSHNAYGDSVVGTVQTRLSLQMDGKTQNIVTTQNTIGGALVQNSIAMAKNDITEPPLDTYLSGKTLDIQVIRALPVLISDNGQSWPGVSAYTQPADILKQLEVEVFPEDRISAELILDPAVEGAVGQKIIIQRAPVYTIYVDDTTKVVRSWATSVAALLVEKGISIGVNDIVEPNKEMSLLGVLDITITRINFADVEEMVPIKYTSVSQTSYDLYKGQSKVTQDGINGSKKQSLHIVYHNGIEVSRDVTSVTVLSEPQTKITLVGTKPYNAGAWWDTLVAAGSRWGVDPSAMFSVMTCESGGNPYAGNYYKGLFQYSPDTWYGASAAYPGGQFSGAAITDGNAQIWVTAWKVQRDGGWRAWGCKP